MPATTPVEIRGNFFYRRDERFLIKGVSYLPCKRGAKPFSRDGMIDPLADDYLSELKLDTTLLLELGINTIQISYFDTTKRHERALSALAEAGLYVLIQPSISVDLPQSAAPRLRRGCDDLDMRTLYTPEVVRTIFRTIEATVDHSNVLGYQLSAELINMASRSKLAECVRSAVRDTKRYLQHRGGRQVPVGVTTSDILELRHPQLQYYTAGSSDERIDFFSLNCFSWAGKSSFRVSGWQNMCESMGKTPVPMFLSEYGTNIVSPRTFHETECLYSPDMTGEFSGGCVYTWFESGNRYGLVEVPDTGYRRKRPDYEGLKRRLDVVGQRSRAEVYVAEPKDYEQWRGEMPAQTSRWQASADIPEFPGEWENMIRELEEEREWEVVEPGDAEDQEDARLRLEEDQKKLQAEMAGLQL